MAYGDDVGNLKWAVVGWINDMYGPYNPPLNIESKVERGPENDFTGELLCPSEWSWDDQKHCYSSWKDCHYWLIVWLLVFAVPSAWDIPTIWLQFSPFPTFSMQDTAVIHRIWRQDCFAICSLWRLAIDYLFDFYIQLTSWILSQAFKFLFTSPASAAMVLCDTAGPQPEDLPPQKRSRKTRQATCCNTSIWPMMLSWNNKVHDFKSWFWFWNLICWILSILLWKCSDCCAQFWGITCNSHYMFP